MKLLLDENLPKALKADFSGHEVATNDFDVLLTFDKNIEHQQNFEKYPIGVLVLSAPSNQYKYLTALTSSIEKQLGSLIPGVTIITAK